ncbi:glycoside hydrolase family 3 protein [Croceicoccus sediminis]|uniref:glycoside hydrolase family 3 protein n=1 Tax=Croceicoccus sediminis TaxID=2571150 RepID=UPI0011828491|nr:glycoside hydrolase family 3 N-terminal domain-containing protein [Croceicoccus sediminis]
MFSKACSTLAGAAVLLLGTSACVSVQLADPAKMSSRSIPVLEEDGFRFRDLDRNGALTAYEDWRLPPAERAADLVSRMTLEEKIGQLVVANAFNNAPYGQPATGYASEMLEGLMRGPHILHFNSSLAIAPADLARANNAVQEIAEQGRLGIPVVFATDPRHHQAATIGAGVAAGGFSTWPEPTGLAALNDEAVSRQFAETVRRDLRATGISMLLGPQLDLATEPRWPRNNGTLGEDVERAVPLASILVEGLQGSADGVGPTGVATVVKHFAGYSAGKDGWDGHNRYGRFAAIDEDEFKVHLRPFEAAFEKHPSSVMPAYTIAEGLTVDGVPVEPVGAAYSKVLMEDLLRGKYGFDGVILSDWAVTNDCGDICRNGFPEGEYPTFEGISMAWGVEDLSHPERFALAMNHGVDQFGGVMDTSPLREAVDAGLISQERIDQAVGRVLTRTFALGLFEAPFVDPDEPSARSGTAADHAAGTLAQARAIVRLEDDDTVPTLRPGMKVFVYGMDAKAAEDRGLIAVDDPAEAQVALIRLKAPFEQLHPGYFFGSKQHEGSLAFPADDEGLQLLASLPRPLPAVVDVYLDRPAILSPLTDRSNLLLANFGASDAALLSVLGGEVESEGRLPFELPRSMAAVRAQRPGTPADSEAPLYPLGFARPL